MKEKSRVRLLGRLVGGATMLALGLVVAAHLSLAARGRVVSSVFEGLAPSPNYSAFRSSLLAGAVLALVALAFTLALLALRSRAQALAEELNTRLRDSITERKKARDSLRASEERLREVLDNSPHASYKRNLVTDAYEYLSPVFTALSGYPVGNFTSRPFIHALTFVHPEDLEEIEAIMAASASASKGDSFELEYRFRHRDGAYRWFQDRFVVLRDAGGRPLAHIGSVSEVTTRKTAEGNLKESEQKRRRLFETLSLGVIYYSAGGEALSANPAAYRILGLEPGDLTGKSFYNPAWELVGEGGAPVSREEHPVSTAFRSGRIVERRVLGLVKPNSQARIWLNVTVVPLFNPRESTPFQVYSTFEDVSEAKRAEEEISALARRNQALLAELQHRAKNSFNMILGMIDFAAAPQGSQETKEALASLSSRVACVSELFSLLYSTGSVNEVRLDDYLGRIADPLLGLSERLVLESDLEGIRVTAKSAAPIGLIATEMITNAVKYAFPGGRSGRIALTLRREGDRAHLEVRDDGRGLPPGFDKERSAGMGLKLIHGLAAQIEGEFTIESDGLGTTCRLAFPIPDLRDRGPGPSP